MGNTHDERRTSASAVSRKLDERGRRPRATTWKWRGSHVKHAQTRFRGCAPGSGAVRGGCRGCPQSWSEDHAAGYRPGPGADAWSRDGRSGQPLHPQGAEDGSDDGAGNPDRDETGSKDRDVHGLPDRDGAGKEVGSVHHLQSRALHGDGDAHTLRQGPVRYRKSRNGEAEEGRLGDRVQGKVPHLLP